MNSEYQKQKLSEIDPSFNKKLKENNILELKTDKINILQLNITRKCNLNCKHCHVNLSLDNNGHMEDKIIDKCIEIAHSKNINTIDITGGSPEMHPKLEFILNKLKELKKRIIVRTNLVILKEKPYKKFIDIYTNNKVEIVASLPYFNKEKFEKQRGKNNFDKAINVLKILNNKGYGKPNSKLVLDLVHNPTGAFLPADQKTIEYEYRKNLKERYNIIFNSLFNIINMPIGSFLDNLIKTDNFYDYTNELINKFNKNAVKNIMCKNTLSVDFNGNIFNCDFNQMLDISININGKSNILDITGKELNNFNIQTYNHCFGCTAGSGSSCQGSTIS